MRFCSVNRIAFVVTCGISCLTGFTQVAAVSITERANANANAVDTSHPTTLLTQPSLTPWGTTQDNLAKVLNEIDDGTRTGPPAETSDFQTSPSLAAHSETEYSNRKHDVKQEPQLPVSDNQKTGFAPLTSRPLLRSRSLGDSQSVPRLFPFDTVVKRVPEFLQSNPSSIGYHSIFSFRFSAKQPWTSVEVQQMDPARGDAVEHIPVPHLFDKEHPLKKGNHTWIIAMFEPGHRFSVDFGNLEEFYTGEGLSEKQFHSPATVVLHVEFKENGAALFAGELGGELELLRDVTFPASQTFPGGYPVVHTLTPHLTNRRFLWGEKVNGSLSFSRVHLPKQGRYYLSTLRSTTRVRKHIKPKVKVGVNFSYGIHIIPNLQNGFGAGMDVMDVRFTSSFSRLPEEEQHLVSQSIQNVRGLVCTFDGLMAFLSPEGLSVWHKSKST